MVTRLPTRLSIDDRCPACGHRILHHPRTLAELQTPQTYGWAIRLCDGTLLRVIDDDDA